MTQLYFEEPRVWPKCQNPSERFCFDPPPPPYNGGVSDWNEKAYNGSRTPFGTVVTYGCGLGRRFAKYLDDGSRILYDAKSFRCEWSRAWTPAEAVGLNTN